MKANVQMRRCKWVASQAEQSMEAQRREPTWCLCRKLKASRDRMGQKKVGRVVESKLWAISGN